MHALQTNVRIESDERLQRHQRRHKIPIWRIRNRMQYVPIVARSRKMINGIASEHLERRTYTVSQILTYTVGDVDFAPKFVKYRIQLLCY